MDMSAYQDMKLPIKHKARKWLILSSVLTALSALLLTLYAATVSATTPVVICVMAIHAGLYVVAQWIMLEYRVVQSHIRLYSIEAVSLNAAVSSSEDFSGLVQQLPYMTMLLAILSFMMLI
jgi:hypothetical protein